MAFDGFVCSAVVAELNGSILNGKINKIFEPNRNEILLGIYNSGKNFCLDACIDSINYRLNLSTYSKPNPKNVFNFCMVLRKHLTGGSISKIYMNGLERVIYIDISCYNELNDLITKTLIIELMGKHSNIILTNSDGIIIDSLRHLSTMDNSIRNIMPGFRYEPLVNSKLDFSSSSFDVFYNLIKNSNINSISSILSSSYIGFSSLQILSILNVLNIDDSSSASLYSLKVLFQYIKDIISPFSKLSCMQISLNKKNDYYILPMESDDLLSVNFFIDDFYHLKEINELFINQRNSILTAMLNKTKKIKNTLNNINLKLKECSKMDMYKLYGELITNNLYRIENYNIPSVTLENYYDNNLPITIMLDSSISPSLNAKKFFKKYRKLQNTKIIVAKQKNLAETELEYLDSIIYEINNAQNIEDIDNIKNEISEYLDIPSHDSNKKKMKNEDTNLPSEYKIDGYTVLVGKNNKQNDNLTCKIAKNSDLWFHTKDIHGSHVVLKLAKNISKLPDSVVYKCATIAAFYSKAKLSQNVPVDYTYIKYVKKTNGAKPGMVIYTDNKTLYVNPKNPADY